MANTKEAKVKALKNYSIYFIPIIIILGFIIYSNALHAPLVFDDENVIAENQDLKNNAIFMKFNQPRYIGIVTFALNYQIHKLDTFGFHLFNLIIHIANAILVYLFVQTLFSLLSKDMQNNIKHWISFAIALIFLAHPVQTQAVTYITQRFTALSAFFAIASLLLYLKFRMTQPRSYAYYILSLLCALLAYKTKENTAALPLIIIAMEYIFFRRSQPALKYKIAYVIPYILLVSVIIISFVNTHQPIGNVMTEVGEISQQTKSISRTQYLITEFRVILTYIRLLILPINQSIDYYYPLSASFYEAKTLFSFFVILLIFAAAIGCIKKFPVTAFGIFWFFSFLLIESSVIPIADVIFEHRIYLPSIGFIIAVIFLLYNVFPKSAWKDITIDLCIITIILSIATYKRNELWNNKITIWEDAVKKYPQKPRNHENLGSAYAEKERYDDAIKEMEAGIQSDQPYALDRANLAYCYFKKGQMEQGIRWLNEAVLLDSSYMTKYYEYATMYLDQQNLTAAFIVLKNAYQLKNSDLMVNALLGRAYCSAGNLDQALHFLDRSLQIDSKYAEAYHDKGLCLFSFGKFKESKDSFLQSIQLKPNLIDSYYYIALSYEQKGDWNDASYYYQQILLKFPQDNPLALKAKEKLQSKGSGL